jgi:1,4-alpha-glucan branching enzyme
VNRSWVHLLVVSVFLVGFVGCAGGWKNGPPGETASTSGGSAAAPAVGSGEAIFTWNGSAQSVHVAGDFNEWSATADPLKQSETDVWTLTKALPAGEHQYKFVINGSDWKEDPNAAKTADDGYGGKNSVAVVTAGGASGAGAAVAAGAVAGAAVGAAAAGGESGEATFSWDGEADRVNLAGDFNNWSDSADPMQKNADGIWQITKKLPAGSHQYKFVINGTDWKEDPNAAETADDGFGGKNSLVVVGAAAGTAAVAGAAAAGAVVGAGPEVTPEGMVFTYAGNAQSVNLAGDFNSWSTSDDALTKNADGVWTISKKLDAGTYSYKFFIDGSLWEEDKANPDSTDDGFGGKNSVVTVP